MSESSIQVQGQVRETATVLVLVHRKTPTIMEHCCATL